MPTAHRAAAVETAPAMLDRLVTRVRRANWADLPQNVRARGLLVLEDLLGVTLAGTRTAEHRAHVRVTPTPPGPATVVGGPADVAADTAAYLNGVAACSLELDEGNKYARGHPAAHVAFAALAMAEETGADGPALLSALVGGYEVAARVGAAVRLRPGVHPHGTWGATGAAAACGALTGLDDDQLAGALDAAAGMSLAPPFSVALDGAPVRNTWTGLANEAGLRAVRLARAGLASGRRAAADPGAAEHPGAPADPGAAEHPDAAEHAGAPTVRDARQGTTLEAVFGDLLGELDVGALVDLDPDAPWMITRGYFKRHASCAYTHPPADAVLELRALDPTLADAPGRIREIVVETHRLAAPLDRAGAPTRLAGMFSIPYVVAVALLHGDVTPARFDAGARAAPTTRALAARVRVVRADEFDEGLPDRRGARVTVALDDGAQRTATVQRPVGDADHQPFGRREVGAKLAQLLGAEDATAVRAVVDALPSAADVTSALRALPPAVRRRPHVGAPNPPDDPTTTPAPTGPTASRRRPPTRDATAADAV